MANSNLFKRGDMVNTKYGQGVITRNLPDYMFWEVKTDNGLKKVHFSDMELCALETDNGR